MIVTMSLQPTRWSGTRKRSLLGCQGGFWACLAEPLPGWVVSVGSLGTAASGSEFVGLIFGVVNHSLKDGELIQMVTEVIGITVR